MARADDPDDNDADRNDDEDMQKDEAIETAAAPQLNEQLKPLHFLEGRWRVDVPGKAAEGVSEAHGVFAIRSDLNGNALIGNMEGEKNLARGHGFDGHLVITASKGEGDAKNLTVFWADSAGHAALSTDVTFENDRLVANVSGKSGMCGPADVRVIYRKITDDRIEFVMERKKGEQWEKAASTIYTRVEGSGEAATK
jgi:hypothetical protein